MKAVRVHEYHSDPQIDDIPEPTLQGPLDVIVKVGGAGVCRTDLHIVNGDWQQAIRDPWSGAAATRMRRYSEPS